MEKEIKRVFSILTQLDPKTDEYNKVLGNLYNLYNLKRDVDRWTGSNEGIEWTEPQEEVTQPVEAEPAAEEKKAPVVDDVIVETKTSYTKEEIRELLLQARNRGVKVEPIIEQFTPEGKDVKLTSIPTSSYVELAEVLKNA